MLRDSIFPIVLSAVIFGACDSDPLEVPCPDVEVGELVVTEVRGNQTGNDTYGEWIELHNPTARTLDLTGLSLTITKLDGSSDAALLVRTPISLAPGAYLVLGRSDAVSLPAHLDYSYDADVTRGLFDTGAIRVSSCGKEIDLAVYRNLPTKGSLILNGALTPSADDNSDDINWCIDDRVDLDTPISGFKGSPKAANPFCDGATCTQDDECAGGSCNLDTDPGVCGTTS